MSDKWDLDRVERAAKAEGYEVERRSFVTYTAGLRWAKESVAVLDSSPEGARRALAAYDAIVAMMAREPGKWSPATAEAAMRAGWVADMDGYPEFYIDRNPAHYPEAAKALRELADWLERQVTP